MIPRVLIHDRQHGNLYVEELRALGCTWPLTVANDTEAFLAALPEADVLVGTPAGLPPGALRTAGHLRLVQGVWGGVEGWLPLELPESVPLARMTRIFGAPIAEYVFGHLLAQYQQVARVRAQQAERRWEKFVPALLAGQTMGIAGAGDIGSAIARRAAAMEMRVLGLVRRARPAEPPFERFYTPAELDAFLPDLDVLVLVLPKTPSNHHLFGAAAFARMKRGAWLVNVGRGHCLDEAALVAALRDGQLAGAVLDVFQTEPLPPESPLWTAPNAVLTPHISGLTLPVPAAAVVWENLQRLVRGEPIPGLVDRAAGY